MDFLLDSTLWVAVGQIILIDIFLGDDNAVIIALACRTLPPAQRTQGILWGTVGAIVLRVMLSIGRWLERRQATDLAAASSH